ncbi:hypothetical protein RhiirB3_490086 [Rhizophagus irregularis]|nr:hypothetical protein RhiirB3_490086 [Rhizophagus irregularis]
MSYNPTIIEETNEEILQNDVLEEVITVDQEFVEKKELFHETKNALQKSLNTSSRRLSQLTITTDVIGDPFEKYFKIIKDLSSWMDDIVNSTLSSPTFLPLNTLNNTFVTDLDILNSTEKDLLKIGLYVINRKQLKYDQLSSFSSSTDSTSFNQIFSTFDSLWKNFNSLIELGKLKLQELKWVIKLFSNVGQVEVKIKGVEAKLEGVEESRKKNDGCGDNPSPLGSSTIESSNDISVTDVVFSSSLLDEWYIKIVAAEESVQDVYSKVKEIISFLYHERFRSPKDLFDHINNITNNIVPKLRSKVTSAKQALAHDRRIERWFDAANDADKSINVTLNRLKQIEIPDFINKREWTDDEQKLASLINDRINDIKSIYSESQKIKSDKIVDLDKEANEIIITIKDSTDVESQIIEFESDLLNDDFTLAKALEQKYAKLVLSIQNMHVALAENKPQMPAYLSLSSPTFAGSKVDRIRIIVENFYARLISFPTYMIDTENEIEEPERIHGLTCNDDHVAERTLWVEFWLKGDPAKKSRDGEVVKLIDDLEKKFVEIKNLMEDRKKDLVAIKEGREFAKGINSICDQLDIVKGEMRRDDTTTDASLQELDTHMADVSELTNSLKTTYVHLLSPESEDKRYKECFDEIVNQYNLVRGWIEEVRVWFREAVRMRGWMRERVEILLNVPKIDPFQEGGAPVTQEQVDEWRKEYEELKRDVENFDFEDVTRLRAHVKAPISFEKREDGWFINQDQLLQHDATSESYKINPKLIDYIRNIIPPTTENFDELFNTSQTPLPEHLIIRQENIEERDKDYLEEYYKFANDILTQRKQVIDYSNETESAFAEWIKLKNELIFKESNPRSDFVEKKFIARVNELNQRIEKSWSSMAEKIIYPHHERHDESESEVIKQAVASYNERLKVLLAEIDEALKNYQRAPKFVELIGEWV